MPAKHTHTSAFAAFGTKPRNVQWSWSARNEETKTVVVTLWQDEFSKGMIYERPAAHRQVRSRHGFPEMMENMRWAIDNADGLVRMIIAVARDPSASPRSIKECFPDPRKMRITDLDEHSGAFRLVPAEV